MNGALQCVPAIERLSFTS